MPAAASACESGVFENPLRREIGSSADIEQESDAGGLQGGDEGGKACPS